MRGRFSPRRVRKSTLSSTFSLMTKIQQPYPILQRQQQHLRRWKRLHSWRRPSWITATHPFITAIMPPYHRRTMQALSSRWLPSRAQSRVATRLLPTQWLRSTRRRIATTTSACAKLQGRLRASAPKQRRRRLRGMQVYAQPSRQQSRQTRMARQTPRVSGTPRVRRRLATAISTEMRRWVAARRGMRRWMLAWRLEPCCSPSQRRRRRRRRWQQTCSGMCSPARPRRWFGFYLPAPREAPSRRASAPHLTARTSRRRRNTTARILVAAVAGLAEVRRRRTKLL
mmetsp:Transcript_655/g.1752  ORF Transcript_655/g.1752 Transcript_655/m.1752 type:complete len:284 (-) Transcript_655:1358-2209(-)